MTKKKISVVICFRDWGLDRLSKALRSHKMSSIAHDIDLVVSDYGSEDAEGVRQAVEAEGGRVVRTPREGPWSRSRALNAGVLATDTEYCITTDADMVFSGTCTEVLLKYLEGDPSTVHLVQCRDLDQNVPEEAISNLDYAALEASSLFRPRWGMGGLVAFPRVAFDSLRGYDARMAVYGGEDIDFANRIRRAGHRLNWVDDTAARIYHIWHPPTRDQVKKSPEQTAAHEANKEIFLKDKTWVRNLNTFAIGAFAKPVATVAIATHNRAEYLRDSINSALAQSVQDIEVLVLDDGSEDHTQDVLREFDDPRLRFLKTPQQGVAAARNRLTQEAKADFIVVHDDDDIMVPNRIEAHFQKLEADLIGTYGGWIDFDNQTAELIVHQGRMFTGDSFMYAGKVLIHGSCMFRKDILRRFRYLENLPAGVDFNLLSRLTMAGFKMAHVGQVMMMHRLHDMSLTRTLSKEQRDAAVRTIGVLRQAFSPQREQALRAEAKAIKTVPCPGIESLDRYRVYLPDHLVKRDAHFSCGDPKIIRQVSEQGFGIAGMSLVVDGESVPLTYVVPNVTLADFRRLRNIVGSDVSLKIASASAQKAATSAETDVPALETEIVHILRQHGRLADSPYYLLSLEDNATTPPPAEASENIKTAVVSIGERQLAVRAERHSSFSDAWRAQRRVRQESNRGVMTIVRNEQGRPQTKSIGVG